jgi:hypothetical protein
MRLLKWMPSILLRILTCCMQTTCKLQGAFRKKSLEFLHSILWFYSKILSSAKLLVLSILGCMLPHPIRVTFPRILTNINRCILWSNLTICVSIVYMTKLCLSLFLAKSNFAVLITWSLCYLAWPGTINWHKGKILIYFKVIKLYIIIY